MAQEGQATAWRRSGSDMARAAWLGCTTGTGGGIGQRAQGGNAGGLDSVVRWVAARDGRRHDGSGRPIGEAGTVVGRSAGWGIRCRKGREEEMASELSCRILERWGSSCKGLRPAVEGQGLTGREQRRRGEGIDGRGQQGLREEQRRSAAGLHGRRRRQGGWVAVGSGGGLGWPIRALGRCWRHDSGWMMGLRIGTTEAQVGEPWL